MSFYSSGSSFSSSFASPDNARWENRFQSQPQEPPSLTSTPIHPFHRGELVSVNQKLDHLVTIVMDQKAVIEKSKRMITLLAKQFHILFIGQRDTAELQQQVFDLNDKLSEVQASVHKINQTSCSGKRKRSLIPKDLCVGVAILI